MYSTVINGINYTLMGRYAYVDYNSGFSSVYIPSTVTYNNKTYDVKEIWPSAFSDSYNLQSVNMGNSSYLTAIQSYAFSTCPKLSSVIIGPAVTDIYRNAFEVCKSLSNVTFPYSMKSVGSEAFKDCPNIKSVTCEGKPFTIYENTFDSIVYADAILKVHATYFNDYKKSPIWSKFMNIKTIEPIGQCAKPQISYNQGKLHFESETEGAVYHYSVKPNVTIITDSVTMVDVEIIPELSYTVTCYAIAENYSQSETVTEDIVITIGDTNGDGMLDINDVTSLVNRLLKKE